MPRFTSVGVLARAAQNHPTAPCSHVGAQAASACSTSSQNKATIACSSTRAYTNRASNPHHDQSRSRISSSTNRRPTLPTSSRPNSIQTRTFFPFPSITKLAKAAVTTKLTNMAASAAEAAMTSSGSKDGDVQTDGDRQTFHSRKILPYSQKQLYDLVADVPSYSKYIPFCSSSAVLKSNSSEVDSDWTLRKSGQKPFEVDAELKVGFAGFDEAYVSRVKGTPFESVSATSGEANLFKSLSTTWSFSPASGLSPHPSESLPSPTSSDEEPRPTQSLTEADPTQGPTLLTIDLAFEFSNPLHRMASQAVLPKVADKMVDAFERRCLEVYGKGKD